MSYFPKIPGTAPKGENSAGRAVFCGTIEGIFFGQAAKLPGTVAIWTDGEGWAMFETGDIGVFMGDIGGLEGHIWGKIIGY